MKIRALVAPAVAALVCGCGKAPKQAGSGFVRLEQLRALELRVAIGEYLRDQRNLPGTAKSVRWRGDPDRIVVQIVTSPVLLRNWPTSEAQVMKLEGASSISPKKRTQVRASFNAQQDVEAQARRLASAFMVLVKTIFGEDRKSGLVVEFYHLTAKTPFVTITQ